MSNGALDTGVEKKSTEGVFVVIFIGTDGAGKSALCEALAQSMPGHTAVHYFGLKHFRLQFVARASERSGGYGRVLRYLLFPLDLLLRRRRLSATPVALIDRVPGWAFAGAEPILRGIYRRVLPLADLVVLCEGEPAKVSARKNERNVAECVRDMRKWRDVLEHYPARERISVDTTAVSLPELVTQLRLMLPALESEASSPK